MNMYKILHLDDDPLELRALQRQFKHAEQQFTIFSALNVNEFDKLLDTEKFDFVILDILLANGSGSGLNLIEQVKKHHPKVTILMSSNLDDPASILECLKLGADEFLSKKTGIENLTRRLLSVHEKTLIKKGYSQSSETLIQSQKIEVEGDMMMRIKQRIPNIINSAIKFVYVEGESGTGKEVVADLFAKYSNNKPFMKLNCAAIPKDLIESELFGHKKGAFTGAHYDKKGVIEAANGGWLFLDEVASLTPSAQAVLLRTLENQEVTPLGETRARKIQVRFISASNVSLAEMVAKGEFRNDLWQRLRETEILLLPLRERKSEISLLAKNFCQNMEGGPYVIEETALNILCKLPWREGNVRELRNCLRAMTENHHQKILSPMSIPGRILSLYSPNENNKDATHQNSNSVQITLQNEQGILFSFEEMSAELLKSVIDYKRKIDGKINITKLSEELKISRSTLQSKIKLL